MNILIINGANLNMLGKREPHLYGVETLQDINNFLMKAFPEIEFEFFQSNFEGEIVEKIQNTKADGVGINAGGYTHYSIVIRDAVSSRKEIPFVEIHLTNPKERENFRKISLLEDVCKKTFSGEKKISYKKAVDYLLEYLGDKNNDKI